MNLADQVSELTAKVRRLEKRDPPLAATFIDTAADPSADLRVIAPGWDDGEHAFGPVRWSPIGGALPQAGDEAVIVERDDGVWQVVAWWSDSQGTGVAQSTLDALDARVTALEDTSASGSNTAAWTSAVRSANKTVAHGLSTTPAYANANSHDVDVHFSVIAKDATNITVKGFYLPNINLTASVGFDWFARL